VKILLDMNLSPRRVRFLEQEGFEAIHWSAVGDSRATDTTIMSWAGRNGFVVFSHDLDFSALLAATQASGPSVVRVRPKTSCRRRSDEMLSECCGSDRLTPNTVRLCRSTRLSRESASCRSVAVRAKAGAPANRGLPRRLRAAAERENVRQPGRSPGRGRS
jgi:predicted nuclease of predicted toxin-antitoxin system